MISTTLVVCMAIASAAIVLALMMWRPQRRFPAQDTAVTGAVARDAGLASLLLSFAATVGLARAQADQSHDGRADSYTWHGSHLDHSAGSGGFSDGGGGFGGGDGGGGL